MKRMKKRKMTERDIQQKVWRKETNKNTVMKKKKSSTKKSRDCTMNAPVLLRTCTPNNSYDLDRQRQVINRVMLLRGSSL